MDWPQVVAVHYNIKHRQHQLRSKNTPKSEAPVCLYCIRYPVDIAGQPGVDTGYGGITGSGAEADKTDLVPVAVLQPADQGSATVSL